MHVPLPEFTKEDAAQLGAEGPGYLLLDNALSPDLIAALDVDLRNEALTWHPQNKEVATNREKTISQDYDYFAHNLRIGSQTKLESLLGFRQLIQFVVEDIVQPLSDHLPTLKTWEADEIIAQRYKEGRDGINFHFDGNRFHTLIVIANAIGIATLGAIDGRDFYERHVYMTPGSVLLLRAKGLYPSPQEIRTEHAVLHTSTDRTSVTLRADKKPHKKLDGITFDN